MKHFTFIALFFVLLIGCNKKNQFIVEGLVDNAVGDTIYFHRLDLEGDFPVGEAVIKSNGSFRFKQASLQEPTFFKLSLTPTRFITLLGDSAEHIKVKAKKERFAYTYTVSNSSGSEKVKLLNEQIFSLSKTVDSLINYYHSLPEEDQAENLSRISEDLNHHINDYKEFVGSFVMDNHRSFASYYALFLTLSDGSQVMNVMDKKDQIYFAALATQLNLFYPESARTRQLYDYVLQAKNAERTSQFFDYIESIEGDGIPEILLPDAEGNEISLTSLKDKVILLSFWGSWDEASRNENHRLKQIYAKYRPKGFQVYQVGIEQSRLIWENTVLQDELPWISVRDLNYTDSYALRVYNVQQLPANYLIDSTGEIIGKNLFGSRLEERLDELL